MGNGDTFRRAGRSGREQDIQRIGIDVLCADALEERLVRFALRFAVDHAADGNGRVQLVAHRLLHPDQRIAERVQDLFPALGRMRRIERNVIASRIDAGEKRAQRMDRFVAEHGNGRARRGELCQLRTHPLRAADERRVGDRLRLVGKRDLVRMLVRTGFQIFQDVRYVAHERPPFCIDWYFFKSSFQ